MLKSVTDLNMYVIGHLFKHRERQGPLSQRVEEHVRLKIIETLTYACEDYTALDDLNCKLSDALFQLKRHVPSSEGIVVRPTIAQRTTLKAQIRRAKRIAQKYGALKLCTKRGPKRLDAAFRNCVGRRASSLGKV